jgi:hypothetical protein
MTTRYVRPHQIPMGPRDKVGQPVCVRPLDEEAHPDVKLKRGGAVDQGVVAQFVKPRAVASTVDAIRLTRIHSEGTAWFDGGCLLPGADCVEVTGCHVRLVFNRAAHRAIAEAPALPELV